MRHPHHYPQDIDRPDIDCHGAGSPDAEQGEREPRGGHPHGRGFGPRGGHGFRSGGGHGFRHGGHGCDQQRHAHHGHDHGHARRGQQRDDVQGNEQQDGDRRPPTLERGIMKAARGIRRSGLTPEQLHHRISAAVTHDDYAITMRTLRRIGKELRGQR